MVYEIFRGMGMACFGGISLPLALNSKNIGHNQVVHMDITCLSDI